MIVVLAMLRVLMGEKFLVTLRVAHKLAVGEPVSMGGIVQRHAFHRIAIISMRVSHEQALVLSGLLLPNHLRFGIFGCFGVARLTLGLHTGCSELAHV